MSVTRILICLTLLAAADVSATSRQLLKQDDSSVSAVSMAAEHQRILAELEEVHQLRERILQQGKHLGPWHTPQLTTHAKSRMHAVLVLLQNKQVALLIALVFVAGGA